MRRYESVVILDPDVPDDDIAAFTAKYGDLIKTHGGEIIKIEDWGYKRLAYLIKKKERGRYILFDFVAVPSIIDELERQFKISEDVLKYLSVKLDDEVDLEAFKSKPEEPQEETPPPSEPAQEAAVETSTPAEEPQEETPPPSEPAQEAAVETSTPAEEPQEETPPASEPSQEAAVVTSTPPEESQEETPPPSEPTQEAAVETSTPAEEAPAAEADEPQPEAAQSDAGSVTEASEPQAEAAATAEGTPAEEAAPSQETVKEGE